MNIIIDENMSEKIFCKTVLTLFFIALLTNSATGQQLELVEAFPETFDRPLGLEYSHQGSPLIYVVQQNGIVKSLNVDAPEQNSVIWFDISSKIVASGEKGLLSLAFHPEYPNNETFYVNYNFVDDIEGLLTRISRFKAPEGIVDTESEEVLLSFKQPRSNHNGGQMAFGPDGYLYISSGDGGGSSSRANSQDLSDAFGDILRIDVNTETGYNIPEDNPFVDNPDAMDEIYSFGFRNPWRMSFDPVTGHLWVADVGETARESIYIVEKGKNYGWPVVEGTYCFLNENCDISDIEIPLFEYIYNLEDTGRSITGGYVYRGKDNPSLEGKYVYGDFMTGRIWALEIDHQSKSVLSNSELFNTDLRIPTFGIDSSGEIYIHGWGSNAKIYRFAPELVLSTLSLKSQDGGGGVQLGWDVNRETNLDSFQLFKGADMDSMDLYDTVGSETREFIDPAPLDGSSFYTVRAVDVDGAEGEMSNPVSYFQASSTISGNWQMMSLPFETEGVSIPNTVAYSFDGSYLIEDQLQPRKGYWIRSTADGGSEYVSEGSGVQSSALQLNSGWNLVGSLIGDLPNEFLVDAGGILNSTPMYGFNGSAYEEASSFVPGQGYWIYADEEGEIVLDLENGSAADPLSTVAAEKSSKKMEVESEELDIIEFSTGGQSVRFYVSGRSVAPELRNRYRTPPLAPNTVIDVRNREGFRLAENFRFEPEVTAREFPLYVGFAESGKNSGFTGSDVYYELTVTTDGIAETADLKVGESHVITEEFDRLEFQRIETEGEIVRETKLLPSYPNPFNPTTNITYRLSEQQQVALSVFDAAGRRIATLVDMKQNAGQYSLPFDASGLASGIYFVRFSAGDVLSTQKLTLIK